MLDALILLLFFACSVAGGWLIATGAFRLSPTEKPFIGFTVGIVVTTWFANILGHLLIVTVAFWLALVLTVFVGVVFAWPLRLHFPNLRQLPWGQLIAFLIVTYVYFSMGRGLAIFDDYQNIPVVSLLATGDIPPHFALDPSVNFGYHYFLLLFAAQIMRLGDVYPWMALDLARAIVFALTLILVFNWTERFTRNRVAGFLGASFVALSGGTRWLLLLVPKSLAPDFAANIHMIGSGTASASDVMTALKGYWAIEGGGPLAFPFAFANGIFAPSALSMGGVGVMGVLILVLMLLTYRRLVGWRGATMFVIFLSTLALLIEAEFILLYLSFGLVFFYIWVTDRRIHFSDQIGTWLGIGIFAGVIALLQGGVLTEVARGALARIVSPQVTTTSYFSFDFGLAWPPSVVSAHLGELSLSNPYQAMALLAEIGPIILVFPLVIIWSFKMFRARHWFEASFAVISLLSLLVWFIRYTGTAGISATGRLYAPFFKVSMLYAVPLVWSWVRVRTDAVKVLSLVLGGMAMAGGVVMLGLQMIAIQKPVYSYFLRDLDVQVMRDHYDQLEQGALIFDPNPSRSPTIFGRFTVSSETWYVPRDDWLEKVADPDPYILRAAGYDYAFIDGSYWGDLSDRDRERMQNICVQRVFEYTGYRNVPEDYRSDFRWLLDLRNCE